MSGRRTVDHLGTLSTRLLYKVIPSRRQQHQQLQVMYVPRGKIGGSHWYIPICLRGRCQKHHSHRVYIYIYIYVYIYIYIYICRSIVIPCVFFLCCISYSFLDSCGSLFWYKRQYIYIYIFFKYIFILMFLFKYTYIYTWVYVMYVYLDTPKKNWSWLLQLKMDLWQLSAELGS